MRGSLQMAAGEAPIVPQRVAVWLVFSAAVLLAAHNSPMPFGLHRRALLRDGRPLLASPAPGEC